MSGGKNKVRVFADSHIGCVRDENQDAYSVCTVHGGTLAVVCDGMGGAAGGRVAADIACETFCRRFSSVYDDIMSDEHAAFDLHRLCSDAVYAANQAVFERAVTTPALQGMGTTLAAAYLRDERLYVTNVGDSRVYLHHAGRLARVSHDDSLVQQMIDAGRLTEDEAWESDQRHLLTRALGTAPYVECGFYAAEVSPGDVVLVCSDGLTAHYRDSELADVLGGETEAAALTKRLIEGTCSRGGRDNVTVVCLHID